MRAGRALLALDRYAEARSALDLAHELDPDGPSIRDAREQAGYLLRCHAKEQAALAPTVTMCDDVAVEADSGGHTDNRPLPVLLPVILAARDAIAKETGIRVRVGAGGGIGCPEAAAPAQSRGTPAPWRRPTTSCAESW